MKNNKIRASIIHTHRENPFVLWINSGNWITRKHDRYGICPKLYFTRNVNETFGVHWEAVYSRVLNDIHRHSMNVAEAFKNSLRSTSAWCDCYLPISFTEKSLLCWVSACFSAKPRALRKINKWQTENRWHQQLNNTQLSVFHPLNMRPSIACTFPFVFCHHVKCNLLVFSLPNVHASKWKCCPLVVNYLQSGQFVEMKFTATIFLARSHANWLTKHIYSVHTMRLLKILGNCHIDYMYLANTNFVSIICEPRIYLFMLKQMNAIQTIRLFPSWCDIWFFSICLYCFWFSLEIYHRLFRWER